jgi:nucleoside 2-deoxyribosyltransferase
VQALNMRPQGCGEPIRIYLAGFDVFRPDALEYGRWLQTQCLEYGFIGLYPLDHQLPVGLSGVEAASWIYRANIAAIQEADIVMANLDDFRGAGEPDSGTVFETGYAVAIGKQVWGYTGDRGTLRHRVPGRLEQGVKTDVRGFTVEDFGLSKNLMIACSVRIVSGGPRDCLEAIANNVRSTLQRAAGDTPAVTPR